MADRVVVGIGDLAVSGSAEALLVTHALGSCVAVCVFDPAVRVAAMLHFLLPDSRINLERARRQPCAFADTGIALLLERVSRAGADARRADIKLVGGAEIGEPAGGGGILRIGSRNVRAAREVLGQAGLRVKAEDLGGTSARTVRLRAADGALEIFNGREIRQL